MKTIFEKDYGYIEGHRDGVNGHIRKGWGSIVALFTAAALLTACSAVTPRLDAITGTTLDQRCVDYRGFLAGATALQANQPTEERAERIAYYRTFIEVNCAAVE